MEFRHKVRTRKSRWEVDRVPSISKVTQEQKEEFGFRMMLKVTAELVYHSDALVIAFLNKHEEKT